MSNSQTPSEADGTDIPTKLQPLEEGTRTLFTKAESREEAIENAQATADDLERAGVRASVEYVGVDIPEAQCVVGDGAVHEVELTVHKDHMDVSEE